MLKSALNTKVPEEILGEEKSPKEIYLLRALLNLLLYIQNEKDIGKLNGLVFTSAVSHPYTISPKIPIG